MLGRPQQAGVAAVGVGGEPMAVTVLDQPSVLEHGDLVDLGQGLQPVGDDHGGPPVEQPAGGGGDALLGERVQPARCLVEHHDVGVGQEGPGKGDELALARREALATLEDRVEPVGQRRHPVAEPDAAEQVLQVGIAGRMRTEQREVVAQRRPEQVDVLRDDGDPPPQRRHLEVAHVDTPDPHGAGVDVPQAQQQPGQRGLAAAGPADDAEVPTRRQVQVDRLQRRGGAAVVGERHVVEVDRQPAAPAPPDGRERAAVERAVGDAGLGGQEARRPAGPGHGLLELLELLGDPLQRLAQHVGVAVEAEDRPDRDDAPLLEQDAGEQRAGGAGGEHHGGGGVGAVAVQRRTAGRPPRPGAVVVQAVHGVPAGPVGPQVLEAAEPLLEVAVELGVDLALGLAGAHGRHPEPDHDGGPDARRHRQDQPRPRVDDGGDDDHAGDQRHVPGDLDRDAGEEHDHRLDVTVDALDELSRAVAPVPGLFQPQRVGGQALAEPVAGPPRQPHGSPHDPEAEGLADQRHRHVGHREADQGVGRLPGQRVVGEAPEQQRQAEPQDHGRAEDGENARQGPRLGTQRGGEQARRTSGGLRHGDPTLRSGVTAARAIFRLAARLRPRTCRSSTSR